MGIVDRGAAYDLKYSDNDYSTVDKLLSLGNSSHSKFTKASYTNGSLVAPANRLYSQMFN